jgi:diamine N-acetyltransferase
MKLYFVRHGESEANVLKEFSISPFKHGLTEKGKEQVIALAQKLRSCDVSEIYASPILRAVQTAEILACELGVPIRVVDALSEFSVGVLEGKTDDASWQLHREVVESWLRGEWDNRVEQGESFRDIQRRFMPFLEGLLQEKGSAAGGIVLVGHGGTYHCMLPLVLTNAGFRFSFDHPLGNTDVIVAEPRVDGLFCSAWGETQLPEPGASLDGAVTDASKAGPLVHFERISAKTVAEICKLSATLSPAQRKLVADNAWSIAQAHFSENGWFRAIYAGDAPVGFIMLHFGSDYDDGVDCPGVFLWRLMIAGPYQAKGYGRQALAFLVRHLKAQGWSELYTSCGLSEGSPEGFYRRLGFRPTGDWYDDELELVLRFDANLV